MSRLGPPVTVGVADKQPSALAFGADEAIRMGTRLHIVHAYVVPPSPPDFMGVVYGVDVPGSFRAAGQEVLAEAVDLVKRTHPGLEVVGTLACGTASEVLIHEAARSRLVVLGPDESFPWYVGLFESRVARCLAMDATCPVVIVPESWDAKDARPGVTVLIDGDSVAHGPLRLAFDRARSAGGTLRIVHIGGADGDPPPAVPRREMNRLIRAWRADYPDVWATTTVVDGVADLATVRSFENTGLLVLGRPHRSSPLITVRRALCQLVIEHAACPVAVVPPGYDT